MRLILYGTKTDRDEFMCSVTALPDLRYRKMQVTGYLDYDSFIRTRRKPAGLHRDSDGRRRRHGGRDRRQKRLQKRPGAVVFE